ncbi:BnaC03g67390D [Brassica napus]|uniref:(rape) hypothetical protein n=1 Tax=Brassica napus TaxID=3708 RepID=A0A078HSY7_BRANA|nr:unnamed protein product [Brassica napus]CDY39878.1 BnaC03g67390D [Brassica napus]
MPSELGSSSSEAETAGNSARPPGSPQRKSTKKSPSASSFLGPEAFSKVGSDPVAVGSLELREITGMPLERGCSC